MAMKLWRGLELPITLKYHVLEGHFFPKLSRFKGLGDYSEDFVEQAHQRGVREESRMLAIWDGNRVAELQWNIKNEQKLLLQSARKKSLSEMEEDATKRLLGLT
jgi:hypothetical protein